MHALREKFDKLRPSRRYLDVAGATISPTNMSTSDSPHPAPTRAALEAQIATLEARLQELPGQQHKAERSKLNKEVRALQEHLLLPAPPVGARPASAATGDWVPPTPAQQLAAHWQLLHPAGDASAFARCVRCGMGSAPTCRFHPDAKAFGFGTGRFDFGYTTLWDTPHEQWFCCGGVSADCIGCCQELTHTTDPKWWRAYEHLSPPLQEHSDDESMDSDPDGVEAMAAMDIEDEPQQPSVGLVLRSGRELEPGGRR